MSTFLGRECELNSLKNLEKKKQASLVVIKGRRRIGKSRLAEEFGKEFPKVIFITGLSPEKNTTAQMQRDDFAGQLTRAVGVRGIKTEDWGDLFWHLAEATKKGRLLIVLDEINWMGSKDPTFLGKLKSAWDLFFKKNSKLIMILSGSMSTWIEKNILGSTGFMGRISIDMTLQELALSTCDKFWGKHTDSISSYEKFKLLSVTGGIPRYLEEIDPSVSAEQNLLHLAFNKQGVLFNEFDRIFSDLFSERTPIYRKIVEQLSLGTRDFNQLCKALGYQRGGVLSEYLNDLVETGYLARDYTWSIQTGKQSKLSHFRLCDNYIRFYLKYIFPNKNKITKGRVTLPPAWDSIMGLQFENLVINNFRSLDKLLKIESDQIVFDNPFYQRKSREQPGCQIDYLIQDKFNTLYVCEIKFSKNKISTAVIEEVKKKINHIKIPKGFSIRPVLITVNGVTDEVYDSGYFMRIIDFSQLLLSLKPIK
jgi:AAA+ ATPase superfamily predicted ATPase